ncbi:MAG: ABC transporter ATP-binding protein [Leifsonia sp.]
MTAGRPPLVADVVIARPDFPVAVAITVTPGRTLALVGPNGAGKSTVLGAIAGLVPVTEGSIRLGNRVLEDAAGRVSVPAEARRVGMVFQDFVLFPHLTVRDNVAFAARLMTGVRAARESTGGWLERYGLVDLADRYPHELSGGQAQRVALARTLAAEPEVLLLDEPMAALDVETRGDMRTELRSHMREFDGATILVTHSLADVDALADDVVVLESGVLTQRGTPAELRRAPATAYVERLVAVRS